MRKCGAFRNTERHLNRIVTLPGRRGFLPNLAHMPTVAHVTTTDLIPTAEVARILGRDVSTVQRMVKRGLLTPAIKGPGPKGAFLFRREDVFRAALKQAS